MLEREGSAGMSSFRDSSNHSKCLVVTCSFEHLDCSFRLFSVSQYVMGVVFL